MQAAKRPLVLQGATQSSSHCLSFYKTGSVVHANSNSFLLSSYLEPRQHAVTILLSSSSTTTHRTPASLIFSRSFATPKNPASGGGRGDDSTQPKKQKDQKTKQPPPPVEEEPVEDTQPKVWRPPIPTAPKEPAKAVPKPPEKPKFVPPSPTPPSRIAATPTPSATSTTTATPTPSTPSTPPSEKAATATPSATPSATSTLSTTPTAIRMQSVLIAGATTPGLTLALLLRSHGFNVEIFEGGETRPLGLTVLNINARRVFDHLGLSASLVRNGYELWEHVEAVDPDDTIRKESFEDIAKDIVGKDGRPLLPLAIATPTLQNILHSALNEKTENGMPAPSLLKSGALKTLRKSGDTQGTLVSFSEGLQNERVFSLIVGTDNPLSKNALPGFKEDVYLSKVKNKINRSNYGLWSVAVQRPAIEEKEKVIKSIGDAHTAFDIRIGGTRFGIIPVSATHIYVWGTAPTPKGAPVTALRGGAREITEFPFETFEKFKGYNIPALLAAIEENCNNCTVTFPRDMRLSQWANNGPEGTTDILIGTAAHRMAPFPMHDTSVGIEDAWMLAKRLAATKSGDSLRSALAEYESARRPMVENVQNAARRTEKQVHERSKLSFALQSGLQTSFGTFFLRGREKSFVAKMNGEFA